MPAARRVPPEPSASSAGTASPAPARRRPTAATGSWSASPAAAEREAGSVRSTGHRYPIARAARHPRPGRRVRRRPQRRPHPRGLRRQRRLRQRRWSRSAAADGGPPRFNRRLDGNFIVIRGAGESRTYRYSHLTTAAPVRRRRARLHRRGGREGRQDRQRPHDRLPPPLRDPPQRPLDRPRAAAARLGPLQLASGVHIGRRCRWGRSPRPRRVDERAQAGAGGPVSFCRAESPAGEPSTEGVEIRWHVPPNPTSSSSAASAASRSGRSRS